MKVEWEKLDKYLAMLEKFPQAIADGADLNVRKTVDKMVDDLKKTTPVSSREHPHIIDTIEGQMLGKAYGAVSYGSPERPALPLEAGHVDFHSGVKVEPVPVFRPAQKKNKKRLAAANRKLVRDNMKPPE